VAESSPLLPRVQNYFERDVIGAAHGLERMAEDDAVEVLKALPALPWPAKNSIERGGEQKKFRSLSDMALKAPKVRRSSKKSMPLEKAENIRERVQLMFT
jgi:hypothetical protein